MFKKLFRKINWNKKLFAASFLWLGILIIIVDQATKWTAQLTLTEGEPVTVIKNFFYLTLSHNTGAAWSLGANNIWGRVIFIIISVVMSIVFYFLWRSTVDKETKVVNAAYMLVFGGAVGNLIDRAFYFFKDGKGPYGVIDFLQFYLGGGPNAAYDKVFNPFPSFNVADASLVIGIAMIIVIMIVRAIKDSNKKDEEYATKTEKKEDAKAEENKESK